MQEYANNIDNVRKLWGGWDMEGSNLMLNFNFNLHNSYLSLHSRIGLASIVVFILLAIGVIRRGLDCFLFYFIGIALMFRIATDTGALIGPMDAVLFYFFYPIYGSSLFSVGSG